MTAQTLAIIVLLVSFFVMIFLRFPIAYAVGLSSVFCMMVQGQALTDVCRLMVKGISSFSLMAVPFFITMGVLMGSGGISEKLIALADACGRLDARQHGPGQHRGFLLLRRYFRFHRLMPLHRLHHGPMMVDQNYDATSPPLLPLLPSCEACWFPEPQHQSSTPPLPAAAFPWAACSWLAACPGALLAIVLMIGSHHLC